jgi:hypothetical protein
MHYHLAGIGASIVVLVEEVGNAAAGISAAAKLHIQLIVAAFTAVAVAIKVTLALFVELGGGVAPRHGGVSQRRDGAQEGKRARLEAP